MTLIMGHMIYIKYNHTFNAQISLYATLIIEGPGSYSDCSGWKRSLKIKMGNYCTVLKMHVCPELSISSPKAKAKDDAYLPRKVKKQKKAEANFYPSLPAGETPDSLEKE